MRVLSIWLLILATGAFALSEKASQLSTFGNNWVYKSVQKKDRQIFDMPQEVVGIFNNQHDLPNRNSILLMSTTANRNEATFSVIEKIKLRSEKLMIKAGAFYVDGSDGQVFVTEYLWTPNEKPYIVSIYFIQRADQNLLLLSELEQQTYNNNKSSLQQLALEIQSKKVLIIKND